MQYIDSIIQFINEFINRSGIRPINVSINRQMQIVIITNVHMHILLYCTYIIYVYYVFWVNYNDLTVTSLEIMVNKGNQSSPNGLSSG